MHCPAIGFFRSPTRIPGPAGAAKASRCRLSITIYHYVSLHLALIWSATDFSRRWRIRLSGFTDLGR